MNALTAILGISRVHKSVTYFFPEDEIALKCTKTDMSLSHTPSYPVLPHNPGSLSGMTFISQPFSAATRGFIPHSIKYDS